MCGWMRVCAAVYELVWGSSRARVLCLCVCVNVVVCVSLCLSDFGVRYLFVCDFCVSLSHAAAATDGRCGGSVVHSGNILGRCSL
jgi:hypothetical protein